VVSVTVSGWVPRPFADLALDRPELAACFILSPGWWSSAGRPAALPDLAALAQAVDTQLVGVVEPGTFGTVDLVLATAQDVAPAAIAHGSTALLLYSPTPPASVEDMARVVATALLRPEVSAAPPDSRCSEPLLAVGEALADAGSFCLASLPPSLRPVHDWLDDDDAVAALNHFVKEALDSDTPWAARRARLRQIGSEGRAGPGLANAAARVVEAFGDAPRARHRPLDLLLAWHDDREHRFPHMPPALRRALAKPQRAGLARDAKPEEKQAIALSELERAVATGELPALPPPSWAPLGLRLQAAAIARGRGTRDACGWLEGVEVPAGLRTGCRSDAKASGVVFARPRAGGGFEVLARNAGGDQGVLLEWPRWVLFPQVAGDRGELLFVDPQGIWSVPLDGHAAPLQLARGDFRNLTVSPDGTTLAAARWPAGRVMVIARQGGRDLTVTAKGGLAWLTPDVVLASDGDKLALASVEGEARPVRASVPCCRSLAQRAGTVVAGPVKPCDPGLVNVAVREGTVTPLLRLSSSPLGIVIASDGSLIFGTGEGIWRWRGGGQAERIGAGLTPGPG
jgi:hypothetical protein